MRLRSAASLTNKAKRKAMDPEYSRKGVFPFLDLPRELRDMVYGYLDPQIGPPEIQRITFLPDNTIRWTPNCKSFYQASFTCKTMLQEMMLRAYPPEHTYVIFVMPPSDLWRLLLHPIFLSGVLQGSKTYIMLVKQSRAENSSECKAHCEVRMEMLRRCMRRIWEGKASLLFDDNTRFKCARIRRIRNWKTRLGFAFIEHLRTIHQHDPDLWTSTLRACLLKWKHEWNSYPRQVRSNWYGTDGYEGLGLVEQMLLVASEIFEAETTRTFSWMRINGREIQMEVMEVADGLSESQV